MALPLAHVAVTLRRWRRSPYPYWLLAGVAALVTLSMLLPAAPARTRGACPSSSVAPSTSAAAHSGAADGTSEKVVAEQVAAQELTAEERSVVTIGRGNPAVQARQGAVVDLVGPDSASKVVILAHAAKVTAVTAESFQVAIDPAQVVEVIGAQMAGALSVVLVSDPQR